jgi:PAS domain S-box-containing protein
LVHQAGKPKLNQELLVKAKNKFELLAETARLLLSAEDPEKIVQSICEQVMSHLDCQVFFNYLIDEDAGRMHLNAYSGVDDETAKEIEWLDFGVAVCGCVARDGHRIIAEDIPNSSDERTSLVASFGVMAYACHPLVYGDKTIGTLSFGSVNRPNFAEEELETMRIVTDQVTAAMVRKRNLEVIKESRERLHLAKEAAGLGIIDFNVTTGIFQVDELVRDVWGVDPDIPFTFEVFLSGLHPDSRESVKAEIDKALDSKGPGVYKAEFCVKNLRDGDERWVAVTSHTFFDKERAVRLIGTVQDVTERKRAEGMLRESARLSEARNHINEAITSTLGFDAIMRIVLREFNEALGAETGAIDMREGDHWVARYQYGFTQDIIGNRFTDDEAPFVMLAEKTRRPVVINDVDTDGRVDRNVMHRYNIKSVIVVPLIVRDRVIGGLFANHNTRAVRFTEEQIDFAVKVGASISIALESARLLEELRESETRLRSTFEQAAVGIANISLDHRFINVNQRFADIVGYTKEELAGKTFLDITYPGDIQREVELVQKLLNREVATFSTEKRYVKKDGSLVWANVTASIVRNSDGSSLYGLAVVEDITERKRAEEERNLFASILNNVPVPLNYFDQDLVLRQVNKAAADIFGYPLAEIKDRPLKDIVRENLHIYEAVKGVLETGISFQEMVSFTTPGEEEPNYFAVAYVPDKDENGRVRGVFGEGLNVTETVRERERLLNETQVERNQLKITNEDLRLTTEELTLAQQRITDSKNLSDALNDIYSVINSALDTDDIMQRVIAAVARVTGATMIGMSKREKDYWLLKYAYPYPGHLIGRHFKDEEVMVSVVAAKKRELVVVEDIYTDPVVNRELMESLGVRSLIAVPIILRDSVWGVLSLDYPVTPLPFGDAFNDFAKKVAVAISLSLENARLFGQTKDELSRTKLLQDVAVAATISTDLKAVADEVLAAVRHHLTLKTGDIRVIDDTNQVLKLITSFGYPDATVKRLREVPIEKSGLYAVRAIKERRALTHEDEVNTPERLALLREAGVENDRYVTMPIDFRGEILGVLTLIFEGKRPFMKSELELIHAITHTVGQAIENARLYETQRSIADTLQEALLTAPDRIEGIEYDYLYRSATEATKVGGDFFDIFELEHERVGIVVGDVSGKGLQAASITSLVKNTIRAYAYEEASPAVILARANNAVKKSIPAPYFVTLFFGIFDIKTGNLIYCSAGHPPALLKKKNGIESLSERSLILGAFADTRFTEGNAIIEAGDVLLLYTDGIIEARSGWELFGEEKLVMSLDNLKPSSAKDIVHAIFSEVMRYTGGSLLDDAILLSIALKKMR